MNIESNTNEDATPKPAARPRRTPTQKQIEVLASLDDDHLVEKALTALHALNRRAKEIRDRRNTYRRAGFSEKLELEKEAIYALKDDLLEALVLAGRATVGVFTSVVETREVRCDCCDRTWFGSTWCYRCDDDTGEAVWDPQTWYVIDCGNGYRFHQPEESVSDDVADLAVKIEPHDPTQPQREIPKVGLTIEAQKACVRLAIERLTPPDISEADAPESDNGAEACPEGEA